MLTGCALDISHIRAAVPIRTRGSTMLAWLVTMSLIVVAVVAIATIVPAVSFVAVAIGITIPWGAGAVLAAKGICRGEVGEVLDQGGACLNTANPRDCNITHSRLCILMDAFHKPV
jgi:hypothetical protein